MSVEIKLQIDPTNKEHVVALSFFLQTLGGHSFGEEETETQEKPEPESTEEKPKRKVVKKVVVPEPKQMKIEEPEDVEADEPIKIEDVRMLLSKKVETHRAAIKAKLTELGANNVSSLDVENYDEFMEFLNSLS